MFWKMTHRDSYCVRLKLDEKEVEKLKVLSGKKGVSIGKFVTDIVKPELDKYDVEIKVKK